MLSSLQRPKKITVLASDGCSYVLLCKPKVSIFYTVVTIDVIQEL